MATIKIVLRKKQNKDGTYPLALRVTKDRKSSYIGLGHSIKESDWDSKAQRVRKTNPNSTKLNNLILKKLSGANDTLIDLETHEKDTSSKAISQQIKPSSGAMFFIQADIFLDNLKKNGKYNRYKSDSSRINNFMKFLNNQDIAFSEITVNLLNQYRAFLKSTHNVGERSIINNLLLIRTIYNQAVNSGITGKKNYPFGKGKIVIKFPDSIKIGLSREDVELLENATLIGYHNHARKVWLLSYYFAGMRLSDVLTLRWSDFQDGRLYYAMNKNLKADSLKIPDKAQTILDTYKNDESKHDFVLPELKVLDKLEPYEVQRKISFAGKRLEETLKIIAKNIGIKKKISMHVARHTFAQLAGDEIDIRTLQMLYRHSKIETTIGYQSNFIHKRKDDALDAVLNGKKK